MRNLSVEEIRRCFASSADFNEIFDAFQAAIAQQMKDVEPYRLLFWNHALTPDEVRLFGEKLARVFPDLAYDVFLWLASVFEVTEGQADNFELALEYYQKAAQMKPGEPDPYLDACDCYDPDLNVPPLPVLIDFLEAGVTHVQNPINLYKRLGYLHELAGNTERSEICRRMADELSTPGKDNLPDE